MKNKLPVIAVFVFILIVMYFLFPRGCGNAGSAPTLSMSHVIQLKGSAWS